RAEHAGGHVGAHRALQRRRLARLLTFARPPSAVENAAPRIELTADGLSQPGANDRRRVALHAAQAGVSWSSAAAVAAGRRGWRRWATKPTTTAASTAARPNRPNVWIALPAAWPMK